MSLQLIEIKDECKQYLYGYTLQMYSLKNYNSLET